MPTAFDTQGRRTDHGQTAQAAYSQRARGLAPGLALSALVIALALGLLSVSVQLFRSISGEIARSDAAIAQLLETAEPSALQAARLRSSDEAQAVVAALMGAEFVRAVALLDREGRTLFSASRPEASGLAARLTAWLTEPYPVYGKPLKDAETGRTLGEIRLTANRSALLGRFYRSLWFLLGSEILRNLLLALALLFLFRRVLSRPLGLLAARLRAVDPRAPSAAYLPPRLAAQPNEIGEITRRTLEILKAGRAQIEDLGRSEAARKELDHQRLASEKLSALGQLTGGVAHDFNNRLAVIMGNADLAEALAEDAELKEHLQEIRKSAQAASQLTHQLLAYSRNQPLTPQVVEASAVLHRLDAALRQALGDMDSSAVELEFALAGGTWACFGDPDQLETVLINLALNARDAMPQGGRLTVEAANAELLPPDAAEGGAAMRDLMPVGDFVCFAVTDSGTGMSEATLQNATDPFFSTKPIGQGSGLGLSMAFGFAKQSGGHLSIESGPGAGTQVRLYIPRAQEGGRARPAEARAPQPEDALDLSGLRLLLVEDDNAVQRTARAQLRSLGAEVAVAANAGAALETLEAQGPFDAYLIDVVLPGTLSGPSLGAQISASHSGARILYMSGYLRDDLVAGARPDPESVLLRKPFFKQDLMRALHQVLEA